MPPSASNRYTLLSEADSDSEDLRIEMGNLQPPDKELEQVQMGEVSGVSAGNSMACLIVFGL